MRPEQAAERAFETASKAAAAEPLGGDGTRVQEGPYTGGAESGAFPRLNFYAQGPASGIKGSQRVLIVADSRVWAQSDDDNHRAELRKLDEAVADALEDQQMEHGDFRIHVINVGSFQPIPGNHDNIRGRRRVFTLQVVRKASAE